MKPVLQTILGKQGNCLCACIASLLEIELDKIPYPVINDQQEELNKWLIANYNLFLMSVSLNPDGKLPAAFKDGYIIGCGRSANDFMHAVLCRNGRIVHDPSPDSGLTYDRIEEFDLLIKFFK
jgi:hypothetical protein